MKAFAYLISLKVAAQMQATQIKASPKKKHKHPDMTKDTCQKCSLGCTSQGWNAPHGYTLNMAWNAQGCSSKSIHKPAGVCSCSLPIHDCLLLCRGGPMVNVFAQGSQGRLCMSVYMCVALCVCVCCVVCVALCVCVRGAHADVHSLAFAATCTGYFQRMWHRVGMVAEGGEGNLSSYFLSHVKNGWKTKRCCS
eukprot:scaffold10792_cov18-Tisochrysis_lutea.AAC.5